MQGLEPKELVCSRSWMKTNALQPAEAKEDLVEVVLEEWADIGRMQADDPYVALIQQTAT